MVRTRLAECAEAPQECLTGKCSRSAEHQRAPDIDAGTDTGIHQHGGPTADLCHDGRQRVDRGRQCLDLTATMVRYHEPIDAERHRLLRVLRMQDALDHEGPLPAVAITRDLVPGECAAYAAAGERRGLRKTHGRSSPILATRALAHIGPQ